jgi:hypothetical protein
MNFGAKDYHRRRSGASALNDQGQRIEEVPEAITIVARHLAQIIRRELL